MRPQDTGLHHRQGAVESQFEVRSSSPNNWTLHEDLELLQDCLSGAPVAA